MQLREFGYPIERLQALRSYMLQSISLNEAGTRLDALVAEDAASDKQDASKITHGHVEGMKRAALQSPKSRVQPAVMALYCHLVSVIRARAQIKLLAGIDGTFGFYDERLRGHEVAAEEEAILKTHHIAISLNEIVSEFIDLEQYQPAFQQLELLTGQERLLLDQIRRKDVKQLTISYRSNGELKHLEVAEVKKDISIESRYKDHLLRTGYQKISYLANDGHIVHFERTNRIKL